MNKMGHYVLSSSIDKEGLKMIQRITLVFAVMVMISGCSDPLVANEANIGKAINEYLKLNKLCTARCSHPDAVTHARSS